MKAFISVDLEGMPFVLTSSPLGGFQRAIDGEV